MLESVLRVPVVCVRFQGFEGIGGQNGLMNLYT